MTTPATVRIAGNWTPEQIADALRQAADSGAPIKNSTASVTGRAVSDAHPAPVADIKDDLQRMLAKADYLIISAPGASSGWGNGCREVVAWRNASDHLWFVPDDNPMRRHEYWHEDTWRKHRNMIRTATRLLNEQTVHGEEMTGHGTNPGDGGDSSEESQA